MNTVRKIWENGNIIQVFPQLIHKTRFDEKLSEHTSFKIGGPADIWVEPETNEELLAVIEYAYQKEIPISILGGGTNVVVSDLGIRGLTISLSGLKKISPIPMGLRAQTGCLMNDLCASSAEHSLSGIENFAGLPGTVGGAVFMNARCYEKSISDVFFKAQCVEIQNGRCTITNKDFFPEEWAYKRSPFQEGRSKNALSFGEGNLVVLSVDFSLVQGNQDSIRAEMKARVSDRESRGHFRYPSAGSAFKNNHAFGKPSGKIIDEAGLRGFRVGDAQIAPWHGNIAINTGSARASDVRSLIEQVQSKVLALTGFDLEPEILFVGEM